MNKTLLLILCDFLLLNLLALTNWEQADVSKRHEQSSRGGGLSQDGIDAEHSQLRTELLAESTAVDELERQIADTETSVKTTSAQVAETRAEARQYARDSERKIRNLNLIADGAERGRQLVREIAGTMETLAQEEQQHAVIVKANAELLGTGVENLKRTEVVLKQAIKESGQISPSRVARFFAKNKVLLRTSGVREGMFGRVDKQHDVASVVVDDGRVYIVITHSLNTPFNLGSTPREWSRIGVGVERDEKKIPMQNLFFLAPDPRVVAVLITEENFKELGVEPVRLCRNPLKFEQGVFVNKDGKAQRVELSYIPNVPWYLAVKPKIIKETVTSDETETGTDEDEHGTENSGGTETEIWREAKELSPMAGDLIFDKMGALIGVMINERYCAVIKEIGALDKIETGDKPPPTLEKLKKLSDFVKKLPSPLR